MSQRVMFDGCRLEFTVPKGAELPEGLLERSEAELPPLLEPVREWLRTIHPEAELQVSW